MSQGHILCRLCLVHLMEWVQQLQISVLKPLNFEESEIDPVADILRLFDLIFNSLKGIGESED